MNPLRLLSILALVLLIAAILCLSVPTKSLAQDSQPKQISRIAWSSGGSLIASANWDGEVAIIDSASVSVLYTLIAHIGPVTDIAWSADDTKLASVGTDQTMKIWNAATGQLLTASTMANGEYASSLAWSMDGNYVITCSGEISPNLLIWDAATGSLQQGFDAGTTVQMAWSPDGQYLALANSAGGIELRDGTTFQFVRFLATEELGGLGYDVYSLAWNSNGTRIASGSLNGTIRIWDVSTGTVERAFDANDVSELDFLTSLVTATAFSTDNSEVMAISANGTLRRWNLSNAQLLEATRLDNPAYAAAFSPDGSHLAYGGDTGAIQVVPVSTLITTFRPTPTSPHHPPEPA